VTCTSTPGSADEVRKEVEICLDSVSGWFLQNGVLTSMVPGLERQGQLTENPTFQALQEVTSGLAMMRPEPARQIGAEFGQIESSRPILPPTSRFTETLAWIVERANLSQ
jgi:hypothetical protein